MHIIPVPLEKYHQNKVAAHRFAENEIQPVARELDKNETFSYETMQKMAELGLFGIFVSEKYGGQGMDYMSYIIATEEIARVDGSHAATVAAGNSLGVGPLYYFGSEKYTPSYELGAENLPNDLNYYC